MPELTGPIWVLLYRQCRHRVLATANWDVAVRVTEICPYVEVREAEDSDLVEFWPDGRATQQEIDGLRFLLLGTVDKSVVHRARPKRCWCNINDTKVYQTSGRLQWAVIKGEPLDTIR